MTATDVLPPVIGERQVLADDGFGVVDPSTGELLATVSRCGEREVGLAVAEARRAFEQGWRQTAGRARGRILRRLGERLLAERDRLARTESQDVGKPLSQAYTDVDAAARYFEFYGGAVETLRGETIPVDDDAVVYTLREPYGVTGHITPWNYPLALAARTVAPALAAGNCCVLKPPEEAPLTSLLLGRLASEAGLPPGVLTVVPGIGEEAGAALTSCRGVDHLAFTGSPEVGILVAQAAAAHPIPATLELGGKSPNIVFADADVDAALPQIVDSIVSNAGQICSAGSRLLVDRSLHADVVNAVAERFRSVRIGPGLDDLDMGPLISEAQRSRVARLVAQADGDARLVTGGAPPSEPRLERGFFFTPTLFDSVPPESELGQTEVFGPVLAVMPFGDDEDALRLANATSYGLVANVWTRDVGRAHWLARELRVGQVYVNSWYAGDGVEMPFGGVKGSGYGREKGTESLQAYTQTKTVAIRVPS